jgi:hypothetical protein
MMQQEQQETASGFTARDRETLTTLKVEMKNLIEQVRPALERLLAIERDRVTRKDMEDMLEVVEDKASHADLKAAEDRFAAQLKERDERLSNLERRQESTMWKLAVMTGMGMGIGFMIRLLWH